MKKADIRNAVLIQLCDLGYPAGNYGWVKRARLTVMLPDRSFRELRLPATSKTTKASLAETLASLPRYGASRPLPQFMKADPEWRQTDLERDYLVGDAR